MLTVAETIHGLAAHDVAPPPGPPDDPTALAAGPLRGPYDADDERMGGYHR